MAEIVRSANQQVIDSHPHNNVLSHWFGPEAA